MITATCQHTGLTFEARSKAAKNHPVVADLLSEANKKNAYRSAVDAIREVREALGESLTLADVERVVSLAVDDRRAELQAERDQWRQWREERRSYRPEPVDEEWEMINSPAIHTEIDSDARYDEI